MSVRKLMDYYDKFEQMYYEIPDAFSYGIIQPDHYNKRLKIATETLKDIWDVTVPYEPVECGDVIEVDHIDNLCKAGLELCNWLEKELDPDTNPEVRYYLFHDPALFRAIHRRIQRSKKIFSEFIPKERILFFEDFDRLYPLEGDNYAYHIYGDVEVRDSYLVVKPDGGLWGEYYPYKDTYVTVPYEVEIKYDLESIYHTYYFIDIWARSIYTFKTNNPWVPDYYVNFWIEVYPWGDELWCGRELSSNTGEDVYIEIPTLEPLGFKNVNILKLRVLDDTVQCILNDREIARLDHCLAYADLDRALYFDFYCRSESQYNLWVDYIKAKELRGEDI